jgi:Glyoxalase-like domain
MWANRIDLTFDCADALRLATFWKLALGYIDEPPPAPFATREEWVMSFGEEPPSPEDGQWLCDPDGVGPDISLLRVPEPKTAKNRLHMDIKVPVPESGDRWTAITAEAARLVAAGGSVLVEDSPHHFVMADPEGNEFCVH